MTGPTDPMPPTGQDEHEGAEHEGAHDEVTAVDAAVGAVTTPVSRLLAGLAVTGLDLDRARHAVAMRTARRVRRRRIAVGGTAAVVVLVAALVLWPRAEPRKVIAADATTSTTTSVATTTTTPVVTTVAPTTVAPTTTPVASTITTVPTTSATTTTVAPNRPMTATATMTDQSGAPIAAAAAGDTVWLQVDWSDPDLADPSMVDVRAEFGDQLLTTAEATSQRPPCNAAGGGAAGQVRVPFRYSVAGAVTVQVEVTACGGAGPYGEHVSRSLGLTVTAAAAGRRPIVLARVADGRSGDAGEVVMASGPPTPKRSPELRQVLRSDGSAATVATIPTSVTGTVMLRWVGVPVLCQVSAEQIQPAGDASTVLVHLGPTLSGSACVTPQNVGVATVP